MHHSYRKLSSFPRKREERSSLITNSSHHAPLISFPGGGIFFWWQAGTVIALQQEYDLCGIEMVGASSGALAATLAAVNCDMHRSLELALRLSDDHKVWERGGFGGIWGGMVKEWLEELLPEDAHCICHGRVHLLCMRIFPWPKRYLISDFESKDDLIGACMASVHIPYFMDRKFTARYRGSRFIDGSFRVSKRACGLGEHRPTVYLDWREDSIMTNKGRDFLNLHDGPALKEMILAGYYHVMEMQKNGKLDILHDVLKHKNGH